MPARIGFAPQLPPPLKMPPAELIRFAAAVAGADPAKVTEVAAPDRLRFLGALSRYAGLLTDISLQERRT
jgi:hypothetical protein